MQTLLPQRPPANGFTLIEVLIAAALLAAACAGIVQLFVVGTASTHAARLQTSTALLAASKLDQLRALAWQYDPLADPALTRTDQSTTIASLLPASGGPGLAASPGGSLSASVTSYVDYLDAQGRWLGAGTAPPPSAVFIRRWSVMPLPSDPSRALVLAVLVTTVRQEQARPAAWSARSEAETLLVLVRAREGR